MWIGFKAKLPGIRFWPLRRVVKTNIQSILSAWRWIKVAAYRVKTEITKAISFQPSYMFSARSLGGLRFLDWASSDSAWELWKQYHALWSTGYPFSILSWPKTPNHPPSSTIIHHHPPDSKHSGKLSFHEIIEPTVACLVAPHFGSWPSWRAVRHGAARAAQCLAPCGVEVPTIYKAYTRPLQGEYPNKI